MATWNQDAVFPQPNGNPLESIAVTHDGTDLFFIALDTGNQDTFLYHYDCSTQTFTAWLQFSASSNLEAFDVAYFGNRVYVLYADLNAVYLIYADGPSSWSLVDTPVDESPNTLGLYADPKFGRHDDFLRFTVCWNDTTVGSPRDWITKYTTDGTSWSTRANPSISGTISQVIRKSYKAGRDILYVESDTPYYYLMEMESDTTFLTVISDSSPLTDTFYQMSQASTGRLWADYPYNYLATDRVRWSDNEWVSFDNQAKSFCLEDCAWVDVEVDLWLNTAASVGGIERFTLDDEFGTTETFNGTLALITRTDPAQFVKLPDDTAYLILTYNAGATVFLRDEPLAAGVEAILYYGAGLTEGILEQKTNLPFPAVLPDAMSLKEPLGTLVVGSNQPSAEMVIYSNYPYDTAEDFDDNIPTGTSISAIEWI